MLVVTGRVYKGLLNWKLFPLWSIRFVISRAFQIIINANIYIQVLIKRSESNLLINWDTEEITDPLLPCHNIAEYDENALGI